MSFGKFTQKEIIDLVSASWASYWGLGSGQNPGGPNLSIQFNSASIFTGSENFSYNISTPGLYYTGSFYVSGAISASNGPNTVGFYGTASWAVSSSRAEFATSASYATTAGSSLNVSGSDQYLARFSGSNAVEISNVFNNRNFQTTPYTEPN